MARLAFQRRRLGMEIGRKILYFQEIPDDYVMPHVKQVKNLIEQAPWIVV